MSNYKDISTVCFGEVLFDILPSGPKPGGAPLNVAIHLQNLGIQTAIISRVGNDQFGAELLSFLESKNVITKMIQIGEAEHTGIVNVNLDKSDDPVYTIVENVAWDKIDDRFKDYHGFDPDYIVYGSLACRDSVTKRSLIKLIETTSANTVFDLNLRSPYFNRELLKELMSLADIVKMNTEEFELLKNWYSLEGDDELENLKSFVSIFENVNLVIITKGASGSIALFEREIHTTKGISVDVVDTVGSGDAFLAGFLSTFIRGGSIQEALHFGSITGAFLASKEGANPEYEIEDIYHLMNSTIHEN